MQYPHGHPSSPYRPWNLLSVFPHLLQCCCLTKAVLHGQYEWKDDSTHPNLMYTCTYVTWVLYWDKLEKMTTCQNQICVCVIQMDLYVSHGLWIKAILVSPRLDRLSGKVVGNSSTHIFVHVVYVYMPLMVGRYISLCVHKVCCVGEGHTLIPVLNVPTRLSRSIAVYLP